MMLSTTHWAGSLAVDFPLAELETTVVWHWPLAPWLTALLAAAVIGWVAAIYTRESKAAGPRTRALLAALRLASLTMLALMIAQPTVQRRRVASPRLHILMDLSGSMSEPDVGEPPALQSRLQAVKQTFVGGQASLIERLAKQYDVQVFGFADASARIRPGRDETLSQAIAATTVTNDPSSGTRLGAAIEAALRDVEGPRPIAIVIASDGVSTAGTSLTDAARTARVVGAPLFTVAAGSSEPRPDVVLDDLLAERLVFPGDRLQVQATVRATGFAQRQIAVQLLDVTAENPESLARTTVTLPEDGQTATARLALRPAQPGPLKIRVEAEPLDGESDVENNRVERTIEVRRERIRVLLASASPNFEVRSLKSLLSRDPAIQLGVYWQQADPGFSEVDDAATPRFPTGLEELLEYDVLLLSDLDPDLLPSGAWDNVLRFVTDHGGGVALIPGARYLPWSYLGSDAMRLLAPLELSAARPTTAPPQEMGFSVEPTRQGQDQPSLQLGETLEQTSRIWQALPPVLWLIDSIEAKPGAAVLAVEPSRSTAAGAPLPVIARHYVGSGEVLMHTTDETWRWRWRSDDRYFARYWGQTVRRLARGRSERGGAQLATGRQSYREGDPVRVRARNIGSGSSVPLQVVGASQPVREVILRPRPSLRQASEVVLRNLPPDEYVLRLETPAGLVTANFVVQQSPGELVRLVADSAGLAAAAEISGGQFYELASADALINDLPAPKPVALEQLPDEPWLNSHWLLALLATTLTGEWLLRRIGGML